MELLTNIIDMLAINPVPQVRFRRLRASEICGLKCLQLTQSLKSGFANNAAAFFAPSAMSLQLTQSLKSGFADYIQIPSCPT